MRNTSSDFSKFSEFCIAKVKDLKFLINIEKQIIDLLTQLNDSQIILDTEYKKLKPRGSKFHKSLIDNCPPLRSILSPIIAPSSNIVKH